MLMEISDGHDDDAQHSSVVVGSGDPVVVGSADSVVVGSDDSWL